MRSFWLLLIFILGVTVLADTPPPGAVKIKGGTDGTTIGNTGDALKTTGTATISGDITVVQPTGSNLHTDVDNFPASQLVTGPLTDAQLRAIAVPVSGSLGRTWHLDFLDDTVDISGSSISVSNFPSTQSISGTVAVSNFPATQNVAVTNIPTVTANIGITNGLALDTSIAALSAKFGSLGQKIMSGSAPIVIASDQSALPVTGTFFQTTQPVSGTGSFTVAQPTGTNLHVVVDSAPSTPITGTITANQGTPNSTANAWPVKPTDGTNSQAYTAAGAAKVDGSAVTQPVSAASLPLPTNAAQETGGHLASIDTKLTSPLTTNSTLQAGSAIVGKIGIDQTTPGTTNGIQVNAALPTGTNSIGQVTANAGTGNFNVVQASGANLHVNVDSAPTTTVTGTVTVNAGANLNTSALALSATQTDGTQRTKVTDGTNNAAVKATSTAAVATDPAIVVAISPNNTPVLPSGAATETTLAKLTQTQGSTTSGQSGPIVQGAVTTNQPTYTTAQTNPVSLTLRGGLRTKGIGLDSVFLVRNDYSSTNVTTATYVQLIASTTLEVNRLLIFDSSGQDLVLAIGAAASEVDQIQIAPGGWDSPVELFVPSGSRVSIKSKSATASSGILLITGLK